ncbi:hypothetical protein R1flu_027043 [Riccia fluitans]|uniref:Uncharacterized protein n=1 Tax=Riccia fluitans TaxID=41844 RepID=A0ABD1XI65_9MARC
MGPTCGSCHMADESPSLPPSGPNACLHVYTSMSSTGQCGQSGYLHITYLHTWQHPSSREVITSSKVESSWLAKEGKAASGHMALQPPIPKCMGLAMDSSLVVMQPRVPLHKVRSIH